MIVLDQRCVSATHAQARGAPVWDFLAAVAAAVEEPAATATDAAAAGKPQTMVPLAAAAARAYWTGPGFGGQCLGALLGGCQSGLGRAGSRCHS